jgi:signal transduction histidine kinase
MKVKNRLSLQFTFMFAILLGIVLLGIYLLEEKNTIESFYEKLDDRALIVGELYLAQDNMSPENFKKVIEKYPQTLSHEVTRIYNDKFQPVFIKEDSVHWTKDIIQQVVEKKKVHFSANGQQVSGLYYIDNSGNFVVIASAIDDSGDQHLRRLAYIMLFAFLTSLIITFILGQFFARVALKPILKITNNLKIIRSTSLNKRLALTHYKNDEINQLSTTINNLLEHLEQSFLDQQSFISNASHELRTPLTTILGNAEITLNNEREKQEYVKALKGIVQEAGKLDALINSLLELAQVPMTVGTDGSEQQKIQLDELLWEVVDEWGNLSAGKAGKPNPAGTQNFVSVQYNLPKDKTLYTISGNRRLLFIAISNILKNAIKFSGDKDISCTIQCRDSEIIIAIQDKGIGIPAGEIQNIFQPFYRATNAIRHSGSGIGLSLAEKIIRLHNGRIEVKSEISKGTEFDIIFTQ